MKRTVFPAVLIFCFLITFISCSNTPKRSRKPVSTITIQPIKKNYVIGEKVSVKVKTKVKNGEVQNIKLYYKNQLLKESKELEFSFDNVELNSLGSSSFRVEATKTDGLKNSRQKSITTVSDIVPKQLKYKIVNTFPHSKEHYTQGLEFHNGFLFEGTGENGSSGVYKVNLSTGKVVQSYDMDEKYFGEGITLLNDKIYQLTYRSQKGFVYDASNFSVQDSFQYKSKQGWGLVNDGKHLIMSDGTYRLSWLDPNDFSIVKTLQVANHKGYVNNLNELEIIDGTIYANIYTTNLIVQIDMESGKVLSEINMPGLIDMYRKQEERIDYMNGIAYDRENNRIFVTGKLWPKLFEVEFYEE